MEATDIYGYLRTYANELGSRILELYPPPQSTTRLSSRGAFNAPKDSVAPFVGRNSPP
jgi:hypothetical protein